MIRHSLIWSFHTTCMFISDEDFLVLKGFPSTRCYIFNFMYMFLQHLIKLSNFLITLQNSVHLYKSLSIKILLHSDTYSHSWSQFILVSTCSKWLMPNWNLTLFLWGSIIPDDWSNREASHGEMCIWSRKGGELTGRGRWRDIQWARKL